MWRLHSWLLNQAAAHANRLVTAEFGRPGLRSRYPVLAGLNEFGPISQAELSRRLGYDRSDLVAVLNDLEHDGLALREPDATDRRRNAIRITSAGAKELVGLDDKVQRGQDALLAPLTEAERDQLAALLRRLVLHHSSLTAPPDSGAPG
jgi:DNA-binding MarR family transcriptional regulator